MQIVDPAGRESTLATVQVDFHQPARFELSYVDSDGQRRRPVMVHRSLVGSMERLFGHLIEVHAGAFPAWYAPVQVAVLPVGADDVAARFAAAVEAAGLRVELHAEGSLGARVRDARKVPFVAVIGAREAAADGFDLLHPPLDRFGQRQEAKRLAGGCRIDDDHVVEPRVVVVGDPEQTADLVHARQHGHLLG